MIVSKVAMQYITTHNTLYRIVNPPKVWGIFALLLDIFRVNPVVNMAYLRVKV